MAPPSAPADLLDPGSLWLPTLMLPPAVCTSILTPCTPTFCSYSPFLPAPEDLLNYILSSSKAQSSSVPWVGMWASGIVIPLLNMAQRGWDHSRDYCL